jgi:hypothetical protein
MANLADIFYGAGSVGYNTYPPRILPAPFVSVSFQGIDVSSDGIYWTTPYVNTSALRTLTSCIWDGSKFIAVGELISGGIMQYTYMTSTDGYNWATPLTTIGGISISYNTGVYLIVGNVSTGSGGIVVRRSINGTTWTTQGTLPTGAGFPDQSRPYSVSNVTYSNGLFVISGQVIDSGFNLYACRWTSTNGITWTPKLLTSDPSGSIAFDSIYTNIINPFPGSGVFAPLPAGIKSIGSYRNNVLNKVELFIEDIRLVLNDTTIGNPYKKVTIAKNGSTYVISMKFNNIGKILYTTDEFVTFNIATLPYEMSSIGHVTFKNGFFYAVGNRKNNQNRQEILKSSDGINWTSLSMFTTTITVPEHLVVR